jgi:hypothetical protein
MSACEKCWLDANFRMLTLGGFHPTGSPEVTHD